MGFTLDITGKPSENAAYGKKDLKSAQEIAQIAGMTDVSLQRDYMAVMSNSMSDEDFAELMKEGVNPAKIPAGEAVTNLDRIKITMAQAGNTIAGYNDDLSEDEIKAVLGNSFNAGKIISDTLKASDLPVTGENVADTREAVMMAANLKPLTEEAKAFMISEDMAPTVDNLYKAEYSAASGNLSSNKVIFDGAATYAGSDYTMQSWDDLKEQALDVIKEAGIQEPETVLEDAKWLVTHELPLTKETLDAYEMIKDLKVPADPKDLIAAVTVAIEEGKTPKEADLTKTVSLYTRAAEIVENFKNMEDPTDLVKHRQLEEVRLLMTKEANLTLLRKGINIETQPLEQLVEDLKAAEREFYAPLLSPENGNGETAEPDREYGSNRTDDAELDLRIDLYKQTRAVLDDIPFVPARTIADTFSSDDFTLERVASEGKSAGAAYEKAGERYEALMTAPRADMGDSIQKAFRNVDDILTDLNMDVNDSNRKAVRTLGYAGMMINRENIDAIRNATRSVETVISLMTPAKTLSMIREGHNPLSENIFDLERSLSEESFDQTGEKYSKFLWRLEKSGNITEDEKQAFIGMYRLFNTVEKRDGKVIGNVLSSGKPLTLENMLEASRTNRHMNEEYVIDDDFGFLEKIVERGDSITSQLDRVFGQLIEPSLDKDYISEKQREIRAASRATGESEEILSLISEPVTIENIAVVTAMTGGMGSGYKKMFSGRQSYDDGKEDRSPAGLSEEDAAELTDSLTDAESIVSAYERFLDKAKETIKEEVLAAESYEDVRALSMLYKQVGFAAALSRHASYEIPVLMEEGWTSVHLTIMHGTDESGKVRVSFDSEEYGKVDATFSLRSNGIDGFIVSDSRAGVDNIKGIDDKIREGFARENMDTANLAYVFSQNANRAYLPAMGEQQLSDRELYRIAKAFIGAIQKA
ncbi:MAG: DUF6240 domain-containing protein [Lachnospiraceae bacterium]|nr:DUF6240 domain-containing protein [Lachnospiraceae bacterium]